MERTGEESTGTDWNGSERRGWGWKGMEWFFLHSIKKTDWKGVDEK